MLMRHAKSSWSDGDCADHDRDLNQRGVAAAPKMARVLSGHGLVPDFVWCSTATRARRTLALMLGEWTRAPTILFEQKLYLARPGAIREVVERTPSSHSRVLVIGHNPGLENLASQLASQSGGDGHGVELPTAAVAVFEHAWPEGFKPVDPANCRLVRLWKPRELADEA